MSTHEDFRVVLIQRTLVVTNGRHVLDYDGVVWMLALLVQDGVGGYHIINDVGLGNLFGAELPLRAQILAVIVAEVVVAGDGGELDAGVDEKVNESRLHFCLTGLEVVATDEGIMFLSKLNGARDKGVLGRAIDERNPVENTSHSKDRGRRDLSMSRLNGLEQILSGVVDARDDIGEAFSVSSPEHKDLVKVVCRLEVPASSQ